MLYIFRLFLLFFDFCFLSTSREIGSEMTYFVSGVM